MDESQKANSPEQGTSDFIHHAGACTLDQGELAARVPKDMWAADDQYVLAPNDVGNNDSLDQSSQVNPLINCKLLLQKPYVDCTDMKKRACGLLTWLYAVSALPLMVMHVSKNEQLIMRYN